MLFLSYQILLYFTQYNALVFNHPFERLQDIKFNQRPIDPLEKQLKTFLRPESMKIITQYFTIPDIPGRLVFMKKAALADNNGDGIPAFEKAYQNVLDSFD